MKERSHRYQCGTERRFEGSGGRAALLLMQSHQDPAPPKRDERAIVHHVPFSGDDVRLVENLRQGYPPAIAHFYVLFADKVHRLLYRISGRDSELEDAVHDTFVRALESIHRLRDPRALGSWVIGIAIYSARIRIQRRRRRRWLQLFSPEDMPERAFSDPTPEVGEAVRALSRVLDKMPDDERIAVVLRMAEGMTLSEAAEACGVSLSTFKRRFGRGQKTLRKLATFEPALQAWLGDDRYSSTLGALGVLAVELPRTSLVVRRCVCSRNRAEASPSEMSRSDFTLTIVTFLTGFSLMVCTCAILSTTSIPAVTTANTTYFFSVPLPSRFGLSLRLMKN